MVLDRRKEVNAPFLLKKLFPLFSYVPNGRVREVLFSESSLLPQGSLREGDDVGRPSVTKEVPCVWTGGDWNRKNWLQRNLQDTGDTTRRKLQARESWLGCFPPPTSPTLCSLLLTTPGTFSRYKATSWVNHPGPTRIALDRERTAFPNFLETLKLVLLA